MELIDAKTAVPRAPDNRRGILFVLIAAVFATASAAQVKFLAQSVPPMEIAFLRAVLTLMLLAPFLARRGLSSLRTTRPWLMSLRSVNAGAIIVLNVYAVAHLTLVDFTAIGFAKPLFVMPLAVLLLGERLRLSRTIATLTGFIGVMMIVQPTGRFDPAMGAALFATLLLALGVFFIKFLSRTEDVVRLMLWSSLAVAAISAPFAFVDWRMPSPGDWLWLVGTAIAGALTQAALLKAYEAGEPTVIAPFDYSRILFATVVGIAIFAELPDILTVVGVAIVIGAGLWVGRDGARIPRRASRL